MNCRVDLNEASRLWEKEGRGSVWREDRDTGDCVTSGRASGGQAGCRSTAAVRVT